MKTITNTSYITDYSGEPPIVTYSNPVNTVIRTPAPTPKITRFFYRLNCGGCDCWNRCSCRCSNCRCNCNNNF